MKQIKLIKKRNFIICAIIAFAILASIIVIAIINNQTNKQNIKVDGENMQNARNYTGDISSKTVIGFIGDSITYGDPFPNNSAVSVMIKQLGDNYLYINDGVNGQTSETYKNEFLQFALRDFERYNVKTVCIMLGTNDSRVEIAESSKQYKANIEYIIKSLKDIGVKKIILNEPPHFEIIPNSWDESSRGRIKEYVKELNLLADKKEVFIGDTLAWSVFKENPSLLWDDLHPNVEGYKVLGGLWADALKKLS
ncbi:MAG: SGNH/GDSL hydrolase family protein [Bifidobacteriaceae bacterium]|jgi:lysophospholipase L1-like esterase|nr:SGNH/GDSL hydrolase family protein [Bifidobacteriaceae bacterium]